MLFVEVGRGAVRAHVGAEEGKVTAVARPHPVVHVAAVEAHHLRRRRHQAHIAELARLDEPILVSAHLGDQAAAHAGRGLALLHNLFLAEVERLEAGRVARGGADGLLHVCGHIDGLGGDEQVGAGAGPSLLRPGAGKEAVAEPVIGVVGDKLQRALCAVVVGDDEAIRRDKRGAAAAQVDDGVERRLGEVGQLRCGELEAERLHLLGAGRELCGEPHALIGRSLRDGDCERKKGAERERPAEVLHGGSRRWRRATSP